MIYFQFLFFQLIEVRMIVYSRKAKFFLLHNFLQFLNISVMLWSRIFWSLSLENSKFSIWKITADLHWVTYPKKQKKYLNEIV